VRLPARARLAWPEITLKERKSRDEISMEGNDGMELGKLGGDEAAVGDRAGIL
jgi:hypothetical protein